MLLRPALYPFNPSQHPPCDLPGLLPLLQSTLHHPPPPTNPPDGTHHRRRPSPKRLEQPPLIRGLGHVRHCEFALQHLPALRYETFAGERKDGVAGDAREDGAVEGGGDELFLPCGFIAERGEEVHGPHLGDEFFLAKQPEILLESSLCRFQLRENARRVVGTEFPVADAAGPGAHRGGGGFEGDGAEAGGEVRAYG